MLMTCIDLHPASIEYLRPTEATSWYNASRQHFIGKASKLRSRCGTSKTYCVTLLLPLIYTFLIAYVTRRLPLFLAQNAITSEDLNVSNQCPMLLLSVTSDAQLFPARDKLRSPNIHLGLYFYMLQ